MTVSVTIASPPAATTVPAGLCRYCGLMLRARTLLNDNDQPVTDYVSAVPNAHGGHDIDAECFDPTAPAGGLHAVQRHRRRGRQRRRRVGLRDLPRHRARPGARARRHRRPAGPRRRAGLNLPAPATPPPRTTNTTPAPYRPRSDP